MQLCRRLNSIVLNCCINGVSLDYVGRIRDLIIIIFYVNLKVILIICVYNNI
jgi:hypothetical protein